MSWEKESASAGLGELTLREVARGAFHFKDFQNIRDPLPDPNPEYGELIKEVKVSCDDVYTSFNYCRLCQTCRTVCLLLVLVARGKACGDGEIMGEHGGGNWDRGDR